MQQNKLVAKFVISDRLGSMNEYINKCRTNHYLANNFKIEQQTLVRIAATGITPIQESCYPLMFNYKFYEKNQRRDLDNVESWAKKCVQDCLVKNAILRNDGWAEIAGSNSQFFIDKNDPRIEVEIYTTAE